MSLTKCNVPTDVIGGLGTKTQDRGGISTQQFKDKFDEMPEGIKAYINDTLTPEIDAHISDSITDADGVHGLKIEEGAWTPVLRGITTAGTNTYTTQSGFYIKTNKEVTLYFNIALSAKGSMVGGLRISGFPYPMKNSAGYIAGANIAYYQNLILSSYKTIMAYGINAQSSIDITYDGYIALQPADINNNFIIIGSITYLID